MSGRREYDNAPDIRGNDSKPEKSDEEIRREIEEENNRIREELENATIIE